MFSFLSSSFFRCDDSGSPVYLEKCLLLYLESTIGCQLPYYKRSGENDHQGAMYPVCNASGARELLKEYGNVIEGGEKDIFQITGCLSR